MHILVVEDEQRLAFLLRRVLLEERHTVDLAHDGHSGLDLALSGTYDTVILNILCRRCSCSQHVVQSRIA